MKLKDAINLANMRDGKPQLKFDYVYRPGCGDPAKRNFKFTRRVKE
jgi:hypothetical protein